METFKSLLCLVVLTALITNSCDRSPVSSDRTMDEPFEAIAAKPAADDPLQPNRIDFEYDLGDGVIGYLTLEVNSTQFVYEGESVDDPAPSKVTFDGNGATLEFTEFRMGMSSGREGSSGEATDRRVVLSAGCKIWASGAFPLLKAQIQNHVCKGTYQFYSPSATGKEVYSPSATGRELIKTWSITFDNGRINRIELVSDPTTPAYIELEIVTDQWELAGAWTGRDE